MSVTINYAEAGVLIPSTDNRAESHHSVYKMMEHATAEFKERNFVFSVNGFGPSSVVIIRSQALREPLPVKQYEKTFNAGDVLNVSVELVINRQLSTPRDEPRRYLYEEVRADELKSWASKLVARHGFELLGFVAGDRTKHRFENPGRKQAYWLPSLATHLTLKVVEPTLASAAWLNGIGRAKGYGFGMLMESKA